MRSQPLGEQGQGLHFYPRVPGPLTALENHSLMDKCVGPRRNPPVHPGHCPQSEPAGRGRTGTPWQEQTLAPAYLGPP